MQQTLRLNECFQLYVFSLALSLFSPDLTLKKLQERGFDQGRPLPGRSSTDRSPAAKGTCFDVIALSSRRYRASSARCSGIKRGGSSTSSGSSTGSRQTILVDAMLVWSLCSPKRLERAGSHTAGGGEGGPGQSYCSVHTLVLATDL